MVHGASLSSKNYLHKNGIQVEVFVIEILFFGRNFRKNPPKPESNFLLLPSGASSFIIIDIIWGVVVRFRLVHSTCKSSWVMGGYTFFERFPHKYFSDLEKKDQRNPYKFYLGSFYKEFHMHLFQSKSFVKFFPNFKLESNFFPHFFNLIRNIESCAHLFIMNFK